MQAFFDSSDDLRVVTSAKWLWLWMNQSSILTTNVKKHQRYFSKVHSTLAYHMSDSTYINM